MSLELALFLPFLHFGLTINRLLATFAFPIGLEKIGWKIYMINGVWDIIELLFVVFFWVETKGKSLEEIDELFDGVNPRDARDLAFLEKNAGEPIDGEEVVETQVVTPGKETMFML